MKIALKRTNFRNRGEENLFYSAKSFKPTSFSGCNKISAVLEKTLKIAKNKKTLEDKI